MQHFQVLLCTELLKLSHPLVKGDTKLNFSIQRRLKIWDVLCFAVFAATEGISSWGGNKAALYCTVFVLCFTDRRGSKDSLLLTSPQPIPQSQASSLPPPTPFQLTPTHSIPAYHHPLHFSLPPPTPWNQVFI